MVASASFGAYTDVSFHLEGYLWQLLNCFLTSAYALYLSGTMERVGLGWEARRGPMCVSHNQWYSGERWVRRGVERGDEVLG